MVLVQNKYKNTLVGVLKTTVITHSSPSCYITLCSQVVRLNSGNLGPQKTTSGFFYDYTHIQSVDAFFMCLLISYLIIYSLFFNMFYSFS